jgi:hypothetical protein
MNKEIVSYTSPQLAYLRGARRLVAQLMAFLAVIAYASSAFANCGTCQPATFTESGGYPGTAYIYVTTAEQGATIFATVGNHYIPANPTHSGGTPTGDTFICGGTFAVFAGDYKHVKCVVYKYCKTDSEITEYELDNTGN